MGILTMVNPRTLSILLVLCLCIIVMLLFVAGNLFHKVRVQKRITREAELEEERYRVATELANDVIFEYNIQTDIMINSNKYESVYGRNAIIYNYTESQVMLAYVHTEDRSVFLEYCKALHVGKDLIEFEFRILNARKEYEWSHIRAKTIYGRDGMPARVIGKIVNIDIQKRELEKLQFKAQRDPLTNIYNKGATKEKIDDILKKSKPYEKHALFVMDIDNFKHVNDTYGHLLGDKVLTTVVSHIDGMFREDDIVGRIGGDEFVAFMRNVSSREQIEKKAERLSEAFVNQYRKGDQAIQISGSIGIAIYPLDGDCYESLVDHADTALYTVKHSGKNDYRFYEDQVVQEEVGK